jgi:hypothetical protein
MESFYGGRQGASFVLVKSFGSKAEMVSAFKQGGSYTAVHYDEYVIINSENKNNADNGSVYRRGYDYTNSLGGAIYVGTIVGPSGRAPQLEVTNEAGVASALSTAQANNEDILSGSGSYIATTSNGGLVPGDSNSAITYSYCSVRDENENDTTAYIGFTFPYTVFDANVNIIDASSTASVTKLAGGDSEHPFYYKWQFNIPRTTDTYVGGIRKTTYVAELNKKNTINNYPSDLSATTEIFVSDTYDYTGALKYSTYLSQATTASALTWIDFE